MLNLAEDLKGTQHVMVSEPVKHVEFEKTGPSMGVTHVGELHPPPSLSISHCVREYSNGGKEQQQKFLGMSVSPVK